LAVSNSQQALNHPGSASSPVPKVIGLFLACYIPTNIKLPVAKYCPRTPMNGCTRFIAQIQG